MKYYLIVALICGAIGFGTAKFITPEKVVTKTETVEVVKEVVKEVKVKDDSISQTNNRQTKTIITEFPDGKKITEIYEINQDTIIIVKKEKEESESNQETNINNNTSTIIQNQKAQWKINGTIGLEDFTKPIYGITAERRIIGPIFAGAYYKTNPEIGITIGVEF